jgi:hypothetical protein
MRARSIDKPHRASSELELLFDLTFVIAVAAVTTQFTHSVPSAPTPRAADPGKRTPVAPELPNRDLRPVVRAWPWGRSVVCVGLRVSLRFALGAVRLCGRGRDASITARGARLPWRAGVEGRRG